MEYVHDDYDEGYDDGDDVDNNNNNGTHFAVESQVLYGGVYVYICMRM